MRKKRVARMTLPEIERLLRQARDELRNLRKERRLLVKRLAEIDERLVQLAPAKKRRAKPKPPATRAPEPILSIPTDRAKPKKITLVQRVARLLEKAEALSVRGYPKRESVSGAS